MQKCEVPGCIYQGGYCRIPGHVTEPEKPKTRIRQYSKKRAKINRKEYKPLAAEYLRGHPFCEIRLPGCTGVAEGIHHPKGKATIELLLAVEFFMAACSHCNTEVERKDKEARSKGLKLSKFN
jgi:hypothetical protein